MKHTRKRQSNGCIECVLKSRKNYPQITLIRKSGCAEFRVLSLCNLRNLRIISGVSLAVDVFRLTRELIDIPSVSGEEFQIGTSLPELLMRQGYRVELQDISPDRSNIIATTEAKSRVVLSTHMDTVPPFLQSSEDNEFIYGRGACDAK